MVSWAILDQRFQHCVQVPGFRLRHLPLECKGPVVLSGYEMPISPADNAYFTNTDVVVYSNLAARVKRNNDYRKNHDADSHKFCDESIGEWFDKMIQGDMYSTIDFKKHFPAKEISGNKSRGSKKMNLLPDIDQDSEFSVTPVPESEQEEQSESEDPED